MVIGNIYIIAAVSVVGGGLFGFDISSLSAQLGEQSYKCYFNQGPDGPPFNDKPYCSGPTASNQGGITSSMAAGSWLGAIISGPISDRMGRKYSIMLGCIIWMIGSAIICASQNIGMLVAGRIINGICVGIESAQVPVYIAEISPPSKRGRLIGMQQWAITWGILIMYYISYGCSYIGEQTADGYKTSSFRIPWGLQMIPAVFLFFMMMLLPESPRWLARKDRWEDCRQVLTLVHGKGDPNHPFVAFELQDIKDMCEFERRHSNVTYLDLFKPAMINRTFIGLFTQIWSQLTGMNVMMYYIANVFSMAGYSGNSGLLSSSITYVVNVLMTIPALLWVDRWGRRPTLMVGSILMAIWMFAAGGILASKGVVVEGGIDGVAAQSMRVTGGAAKGLIAVTYLFVASFAPTWGPVSWTYPPELYPLRLRGKGCALATSANWAFNTALGEFVPPAFANIKWRTYMIFGVFNIAAFFHVLFIFPETAGKTLEETEAMFEDPNGFKYLGTPAWKTSVVTASTSRVEHGDLEGAKKAVDKMDRHEDEKPAADTA
ncbi:high affinity glucose transporter, variant 2 [Purpureocillium takamizusanense]|uniref:High affinity glucose transporter, variant 2 n=2 Tax=Purpureocillium takamizusanense TaxID=2060973 RepID=A0A9Q8QFX7_9HYPO|nr:high affinity glucose transporter, variant 2 [Purpureocillium takamizusanense]UNI17947.1 high affinity glucose transporter, variant 2 [Purpureocillium takamizusanense]